MVSVLVLDCEGIHASDRDQKFGLNLFCLAILLSSHLIYNANKPIEREALETLDIVASLSQTIRLSEDLNAEDF